MNRPQARRWLFLTLGALLHTLVTDGAQSIRLEQETEVGHPGFAGSTSFDTGTQSYTIAGGGENMWSTNDSFHFVWARLTGDFTLQAAVEWLGAAGNPHRKACLIARQTLAEDSPYIDVAVHGNGLISLQWRESRGGPTREIQALQAEPGTDSVPRRVALVRQGNVFFLGWTLKPGAASGSGSAGQIQPAGAYMRLPLTEPLYVGLGVCAHDDKRLEKARFRQVSLELAPVLANKPRLHCTLETVNIASKDRRAVFYTTNLIEAPNWSRDGRWLLFNSRGRIYRLPLAGGAPEAIDTGFAQKCNNDHGLSPDGRQLAISDQSRDGKSLIYILPLAGGTPQLITTSGPSYWHGWSPDGTSLAYCGERNGEFDVYTIAAAGGQEKRLTAAKGLDDGPDYTPDGKYIYFNSERSGSMQIWRMKADGTDPEQVTRDESNNWFPHPSPDGKWLVFLAYDKSVTGHPANQPVQLRLMSLGGGPSQPLARLFGGQGTINVPSWSPDSRELAFVSYELLRD